MIFDPEDGPEWLFEKLFPPAIPSYKLIRRNGRKLFEDLPTRRVLYQYRGGLYVLTPKARDSPEFEVEYKGDFH